MPFNPKKSDKKQNRRPRDDDDSSVDSHGNIRDLIAYSTESSRSADRKARRRRRRDEEESEEERPRRRAAAKAEKRIKRELEEERYRKEEKRSRKEEEARRRRRKEETESEDETEEETEEDSDETEETEESRDRRRRNRRRKESSSEEESEEEYEDEDDEEEDEDEQEYDENEEDDEDGPRLGGIELLISDLAGAAAGPQKPRKYKLKKEPENVRRFVKLVQGADDEEEVEIDRDITYFKSLTPKAQDRLMTKLQAKATPAEPTVPLRFQILSKEVPAEVERVALAKYEALQNIDPSTTEYYKANQWIQGYTQLPLGIYKDLPVKLADGAEACSAFVSSVRKSMDDAIYGHEEAKIQILQFVSAWIANPTAAGNVLSIHGPPGVGKTTLIKDGVAKALGRPFHFITLGGATDASFLDGHSYTYEGSTWGRIVDSLIKSKCMNPVFYFDELDKVSETPKGEEINNLLIHLTDGSQNDRFQDKYFSGIDLDLSRCLFIFSHNDHGKVNPILKDRMYNIQVDGFNTKQKLVIAENYLLAETLREVNLFEKIGISKDILNYLIEQFSGDEKGVRELKRCIQTLVSKLNLLRFYNDPARVPFAIEGFTLPFKLERKHVDILLKKKPVVDPSISHLYA